LRPACTQRLGLASLVSAIPKILLMDEPFGAARRPDRQIDGTFFWICGTPTAKRCCSSPHDLRRRSRWRSRVIMSAGPNARIIGDWRVELPRRAYFEVRLEKEFHALHSMIGSVLQGRVVKRVTRNGSELRRPISALNRCAEFFCTEKQEISCFLRGHFLVAAVALRNVRLTRFGAGRSTLFVPFLQGRRALAVKNAVTTRPIRCVATTSRPRSPEQRAEGSQELRASDVRPQGRPRVASATGGLWHFASPSPDLPKRSLEASDKYVGGTIDEIVELFWVPARRPARIPPTPFT